MLYSLRIGMSNTSHLPDLDYSVLNLDARKFNSLLLSRIHRIASSSFFQTSWRQATYINKMASFLRDNAIHNKSINDIALTERAEFRNGVRKLFKKQRRDLAASIEHLELADLIFEVDANCRQQQQEVFAANTVADFYTTIEPLLKVNPMPLLEKALTENNNLNVVQRLHKLYQSLAQREFTDNHSNEEEVYTCLFIRYILKLYTVQRAVQRVSDHYSKLTTNADAQFQEKLDNKYVGVYLDANGEFPTRYLIYTLMGLGYKVVVPLIDNDHIKMSWVVLDSIDFADPDYFTYNDYDIIEPVISDKQPQVSPELIYSYFVPLVACDGLNNRIGMGKGYFDRFINYLNKKYSLANYDFVGLGFSWQQIETCFPTSFDQPLHSLLLSLEDF